MPGNTRPSPAPALPIVTYPSLLPPEGQMHLVVTLPWPWVPFPTMAHDPRGSSPSFESQLPIPGSWTLTPACHAASYMALNPIFPVTSRAAAPLLPAQRGHLILRLHEVPNPGAFPGCRSLPTRPWLPRMLRPSHGHPALLDVTFPKMHLPASCLQGRCTPAPDLAWPRMKKPSSACVIKPAPPPPAPRQSRERARPAGECSFHG